MVERLFHTRTPWPIFLNSNPENTILEKANDYIKANETVGHTLRWFLLFAEPRALPNSVVLFLSHGFVFWFSVSLGVSALSMCLPSGILCFFLPLVLLLYSLQTREELLFLCHPSNPRAVSFLPLLVSLNYSGWRPMFGGYYVLNIVTGEQKDLVTCAFDNSFQSLLKAVSRQQEWLELYTLTVERKDIEEKLCLMRDCERF